MRVVGFHCEQPSQSGGNFKRVTPEEIWKGIKAAAQEEVRQSSPLIIYPEFNAKPKGSSVELTIIKGSVDNLDFGNDPYELPFRKQMLIEALASFTRFPSQSKPGTCRFREGNDGLGV